MSRKLEIMALSAEELRLGLNPVKKNAFAVVRIGGNPNQTRMTRPDNDGGSNPAWDERLEMEITPERTPGFINLEVYCKTSLAGDRRVGTARVPVEDLMGGYAPEGYLHCLSYRLWDDRGRRNGIVNFSARVMAATSDYRGGWLPQMDGGGLSGGVATGPGSFV